MQERIAEDRIYLATPDCIKDTARLKWGPKTLYKVFQDLTDKHYRESVWCNTGSGLTGKGMWIPCDDFVIFDYVDDQSPLPWPQIYLKFGLLKSGQTMAMVSCHN